MSADKLDLAQRLMSLNDYHDHHPFKAKAEKEAEYSAEYRKAVDDVNRMNDKGEIPPTPYRAPDKDGA